MITNIIWGSPPEGWLRGRCRTGSWFKRFRCDGGSADVEG